MTSRKEKREEEHAQELARFAAIGRELGNAIRQFPVNHTVKHEYGKHPRPSYVNVEIIGYEGRPFIVGGGAIPLADGKWLVQPSPGIPVPWITGRDEDAKLPHVTMRLVFDYDSRT